MFAVNPAGDSREAAVTGPSKDQLIHFAWLGLYACILRGAYVVFAARGSTNQKVE
jgi:hypothetical protein